uniref:Uncharacterized protein n=1 Tax=Arundo donax TaxID=35708 RepID=A0A0A8ZXV9_ARUDO
MEIATLTSVAYPNHLHDMLEKQYAIYMQFRIVSCCYLLFFGLRVERLFALTESTFYVSPFLMPFGWLNIAKS